MTRLFWVAILLVSLCAVPAVFAKPELEGSSVLAHGQCEFFGKTAYCVLVLKDDTLYIAVHDKKGEHSIYQVMEIPDDGEFSEKNLLLLWTRASA